ncbi:Imm32 family immunity protein [Pseudodesulfovibrio piezophilus]|uniref:Uncharacterized protein n=1 Tax=Pseudodesulfovibrio piezophilus (strain DSM 21447 / JCM 15486 / C1TLV30) TaxID=1322246 RepID=M1WVV6_PSEP2|nr:hypothetical protein [Pseudodesulfovibrio piezophilus]CCH48763.1 conserved protein of unknown function [Pseudodesulfovibrio piezophilus C1TLV30]
MKYTLDISDDNFWEVGAEIEVQIGDDFEAVIKANAKGFISLARLCLQFSLDDVRAHDHLHLDVNTGLEEGSTELIIERT